MGSRFLTGIFLRQLTASCGCSSEYLDQARTSSYTGYFNLLSKLGDGWIAGILLLYLTGILCIFQMNGRTTSKNRPLRGYHRA